MEKVYKQEFVYSSIQEFFQMKYILRIFHSTSVTDRTAGWSTSAPPRCFRFCLPDSQKFIKSGKQHILMKCFQKNEKRADRRCEHLPESNFQTRSRVGRKKERQDTLWGLFGKMDKEHRTHRWSLRRNAENVLLSTYERWPAPQ